MTYAQLVRKIQTAGTWFVGSFMGEILMKYPEIYNDSNNRKLFIEYMYEEYGKAIDYTYDSTKTKCNAVISIIDNGKVLEALEYVLNANDKKVFDGAKENAKVLINAINEGKIQLP